MHGLTYFKIQSLLGNALQLLTYSSISFDCMITSTLYNTLGKMFIFVLAVSLVISSYQYFKFIKFKFTFQFLLSYFLLVLGNSVLQNVFIIYTYIPESIFELERQFLHFRKVLVLNQY